MITPIESFDPISFRRFLHQYPELSHHERQTAELISRQLRQFGLSPKTELGGYGVVVEFDSGQAGRNQPVPC